MTAEREAYDRGTWVRGLATIGGAFLALIAVIVSISIIGGLVSVQGALNGILSGAGQALFDAVAN